jgi:hypothetical protein
MRSKMSVQSLELNSLLMRTSHHPWCRNSDGMPWGSAVSKSTPLEFTSKGTNSWMDEATGLAVSSFRESLR